MESQQKFRLVLGVVGVGILAALPFVRLQPTSTDPARVSDARRLEVRDVAPRVTTEIAASPAVGLQDHDRFDSGPMYPATPVISRSQLDEHGLPPELPGRYHSLFQNAPPAPARVLNETTSPREAEMSLSEPKVRAVDTEFERTHRIVDGDTLARLAKRYWGDETLAEQLYQANRAVLNTPDPLPLGVTLRIPATPQPVVTEELPSPPAANVVKQPALLPPARPARVLEPTDDEALTPIPPGTFSDRR